MTFQKGHKIGNRFSTFKQPSNSGRKCSHFKQVQKAFDSLDDNERLSKEDLLRLLKYIIMCNRYQLEEVARHPDIPIIMANQIKAIVTDLAKGKTETVDRIWDLVFGKTIEPIEIISTNGLELIPKRPMSRKDYEIMYKKLKCG